MSPVSIAENQKKIAEGKTKVIFQSAENDDEILIYTKDTITAFNAQKKDVLESKGKISNELACMIFEFLQSAGLDTHFIRRADDTSFVARKCEMIPLEVICRRIATGSFLKRNKPVVEGTRFAPVVTEITLKDDEQGDPLVTDEQVVYGKLADIKLQSKSELYSLTVQHCMYMKQYARAVFEILEMLWNIVDCQLVDLKVEFGVDIKTGKIVLADVVDNDSWRLWPHGDKSQMKDKQVYRDDGNLEVVIENYRWVNEQFTKALAECKTPTVAIIMGSKTDWKYCESKIKNVLDKLHVPSVMKVYSAHKATAETLREVAELQQRDNIQVIIAVAGRSNGLGPVTGKIYIKKYMLL